MNDFLSKLLAGLPKPPPQDMEENDPYLAPDMLPSPLMSPMQALEQEKMGKKVQLRPFEEEQIQATAPMPAKMNTGMPPTTNAQDVNKLEIPQAVEVKKQATLEELLSNMQGPKSDDELGAAQQGNQDYIRNILMARAANKIGTSIAGVKSDEKYGQDFIDLSNKKVTDLQDKRKSEREMEDQGFQRRNQVISEKKAIFELGDKEKENDPNSDVSKAFREYMRSYASVANVPVKIDDRMSMADLQKTTGMLGNIVSAKMAQDARRDNLKLAQENKKGAKDSKKEIDNLNWADKTAVALTKNPFMANFNKIKQNAMQFDNALKDPSGTADIAALYSYVKFLDSESAVREGEIDLLMRAVGGIDVVKLKMEKAIASGESARVLPKNIIQAMAKSNEILKKKLATNVSAELSRVEKQAEARGADIYTAVPDYDNLKAEVSGAPQEDPRIEAFMKKNNIKDKNEAIKILKGAGKI